MAIESKSSLLLCVSAVNYYNFFILTKPMQIDILRDKLNFAKCNGCQKTSRVFILYSGQKERRGIFYSIGVDKWE